MQKTIGPSKDVLETLDKILKEKGPFTEEKHVALFAMAYAISKGVDPTKSNLGNERKTKWQTGSFFLDKDIQLEGTLSAFYPGQEDYSIVFINLVDEGLRLIQKEKKNDIRRVLQEQGS